MEAYITEFVCSHRLHDKVWVRFTPNRVSCTGAIQRSNRNSNGLTPNTGRNRHVFWVSTHKPLREHELRMFVAHEIGTHLLRVVNDEVQVGVPYCSACSPRSYMWCFVPELWRMAVRGRLCRHAV